MPQPNLVKSLKETYWFFTGQSQWAPNWLDRLPDFFCPIYQGQQEFRWFGTTISTDSIPGDTLFMYWQRELQQWFNENRKGGDK